MNILAGWRTYIAIAAFAAAGLVTAFGYIDATRGTEIMTGIGIIVAWFQRAALARVEKKLDQ